MAKKKSNPQQVLLSPVKYIRTKVRTLPIVHCYINEGWYEEGLASIFVVREHKAGSYTVGRYLVDTYCVGVKDADYYFNIAPFELEDLMELYPYSMVELSYNEAHNIIYGALAYAEDLGIKPHPDFALAQYILEEDDEDVPLIEYEYGKDGEPFLVVKNKLEADKYLSVIRKKTGKKVSVLIRDDVFADDDYDDYEEMDDDTYDDDDMYYDDPYESLMRNSIVKDKLAKIKELAEYNQTLPHIEYSYVHPEYPSELKLHHPELLAFYDSDYANFIPDEKVSEILALPRATLVEDLSWIIFYELGKICDSTVREMYRNFEALGNALTHAFFFIGELRAEECLPAVFEVFRQKPNIIETYFGDTQLDVFTITLYNVVRNRLADVMEFLKEPGLCGCYPRVYLIDSVAAIAAHEPERRDEILNWFRDYFSFMKQNISNAGIYDASLIGRTIFTLLVIHAFELLPEIKEFYDVGMVDLTVCGKYEKLAERMSYPESSYLEIFPILNIYERYKDYYEEWN